MHARDERTATKIRQVLTRENLRRKGSGIHPPPPPPPPLLRPKVNSWCLRNKVKLACGLQSLSCNVIMQVLFSAAVIVLIPVQ